MRNITPEEDLPVWQKEAIFPEKPQGVPYGYVPYKGQAVGARSMKELKVAFSQEEGSVYGVWVPHRERIIPVAEAPELLEELKPKRIRESQLKLKNSRLAVFIACGALIYFAFPAIQHKGWKFYEYQGLGMIAIMAVIFAFQPHYQAWKEHQSAKKLSRDSLEEEAKEMRFEIWVSRQKAPYTKALTFVLVGLSIVQVMGGGGFWQTAEEAGLVNKAQLNGETWRLWTAPFLHGGFIHIFFNATALWYLGKRVEVLSKWPHFLMVFISAALFGSFCSIQFLPLGKEGVGASGGIMGLLGFLLTFELLHPKLAPKPARRRLVASIFFIFLIGFIGVSFIDNAAHAGGLIAGVVYAFLTFSKSESAKRPEMQGADWLVGIGALILISWCVLLTFTKIS